MNLTYKKALITGASSGLGRGLAAWFARQGVVVYAAARRTEALETLKREVGEGIVPVALDVSQTEKAHDRIVALDAEAGGFDLVIANAGVAGVTNGRALDWGVVRSIIEVNVLGAAATISAVLPAMVARQSGHVVGISSLAAFIAAPRLSTYCASKAFFSMWLNGLRHDLKDTGVSVTTVQPGYVKSEMTDKANPKTMPFLLETDDAVERIGNAIVRRAKVFSFPWQISTSVAVTRLMPESLVAKIVNGLV